MVFQSCKKDEIEKKENFDQYYLLHNKALNYLYYDIFYHPNKYDNSNIGSIRVKGTIKKYLKDNITQNVDTSYLNKFWYNYENYDFKSDKRFKNIVESYYYDRIVFIIKNFKSTVEVSHQINKLIIELENDTFLSDFDKTTLKSASLIANESFEYWTINSGKWVQLGDSFTNLTVKSYEYEIIKSDIDGAIGGAITGAITGAPLGGGAALGALLGAMLGAPYSSAYYGTRTYFGWY